MQDSTKTVVSVEITPAGGVGGDFVDDNLTNLTGSCFLIKINYQKGFSKHLMVDFGFHQGNKHAVELNQILPIDISKLNAVILTHAHVDHSGRIPYLYKMGYEGFVYHSSHQTMELSSIQWEDAAKLMLKDYEARLHTFNKDRKVCGDAGRLLKQRNGAKNPKNGNRMSKPTTDEVRVAQQNKESILKKYGVKNIDEAAPYPPIYLYEDVEKTRAFSRVLEGTIKDVPGIVFKTFQNGHILGSRSILMSFTNENGQQKNVLFSGDLGNYDKPFSPHGNPVTDERQKIDAVFCETTYGGTLRNESYYQDGLKKFIDDIKIEISKGKTVIIPAFAMDRSQEILYQLRNLVGAPVYYDTKIGNMVLPIYESNIQIYKESVLKYSILTDENRGEFFKKPNAKIVVVSSGMCNGGPVIEHLMKYIGDENAVFMLTGYMSPNTIGGKLYKGTKLIYLRNKPFEVKAKVLSYNFFSSHGDEKSLLRWLEGWNTNTKTKIYLNHGDIEESSLAFKHTIERKMGRKSTRLKGRVVVLRINRAVKVWF